jgi:hypothetical protein
MNASAACRNMLTVPTSVTCTKGKIAMYMRCPRMNSDVALSDIELLSKINKMKQRYCHERSGSVTYKDADSDW